MDNGNQLAYPYCEVIHGQTNDHFGLTKRELFAAMAMQGLFSSETAESYYKSMNDAARAAVKAADALLAALEASND